MAKHNLIIGGGPAATNALETIREFDADAAITLICDEPTHSRMALPYWLAGKIPEKHTHTGDDAYFQKLNVTVRIGERVDRVDPVKNSVMLSGGDTLNFDNLLIATGSSPVSPPIPGKDLSGVQPMWSLAHTQSVLDATAGMEKPRVVLVGAGFIGFIVLNAMFKRQWELSVVERESQVLPRMLDADAAAGVADYLTSQGVGIHTGTSVTEIKDDGGAKIVQLENGTSLPADIVILATGIKTNLELIDGSGITTDQGILVNDRMQSNFENIYAAGDIAQGPDLYGDQNAIHAIQTTAVDHGRVAGANMAGQDVRYPGSLLMNIADVCGLQCASFGNWNDPQAEVMTVNNTRQHIYRKFLWTEDQLTGAIFTGDAKDVGMLTDIGMIKGILQTQTSLGNWKEYLRDNPFDVRRAYIGAGVAQKLVGTTLTGRPARPRQFHFGGNKPAASVGPAHTAFVSTKAD